MCSNVPWSSLAALLDVGAGIFVWVWFTQKARDKTNEWMDLLGIEDRGLENRLVAGYIATAAVVAAVAVLIIICACWRTCSLERKAIKTGSPRGTQCFLTCSGILGFLCWLCVIWLVVVIAFYACWGTASFTVQQLSKSAASLFGDQGDLTNLRSLADDLTAQYNAFLNTLVNPERSQFQSRFGSLVTRIGSATGNSQTCPSYCLDLDGLNFVKNAPCVCEASTIQRSEQLARDTLQNVIYAVVGLFVLLIGELMLLLNMTAMFHETTALQYAIARVDHHHSRPEVYQVHGDEPQLVSSRTRNQFYQA